MSRPLEGEVRAASITASAPGPRLVTQASNFSWCRRWAAIKDTGMVSIPNCRKHSVSKELEGSSRSTKAARAAAFLVGRTGAGAVPKAFCIRSDDFQYVGLLWRAGRGIKRTLRGKVLRAKGSLPGRDWRVGERAEEYWKFSRFSARFCLPESIPRGSGRRPGSPATTGDQRSNRFSADRLPGGVRTRTSGETAARHWSRRSQRNSTWRIPAWLCGRGWGRNPSRRFPDLDGTG